MKAVFLIIVALIIIPLAGGGCGGDAKSVAVTINDLITNPEQYSGKTVTVEGIYVRGWEVDVLAESAAFLGTGKAKELKPVGATIWFAGLVPVEVQNGLYKFDSAQFGVQSYGKVRVTGLFETEGDYGNMNQYKYRITATKIELLDWTPPE